MATTGTDPLWPLPGSRALWAPVPPKPALLSAPTPPPASHRDPGSPPSAGLQPPTSSSAGLGGGRCRLTSRLSSSRSPSLPPRALGSAGPHAVHLAPLCLRPLSPPTRVLPLLCCPRSARCLCSLHACGAPARTLPGPCGARLHGCLSNGRGVSRGQRRSGLLGRTRRSCNVAGTLPSLFGTILCPDPQGKGQLAGACSLQTARETRTRARTWELGASCRSWTGGARSFELAPTLLPPLALPVPSCPRPEAAG